MLIGLFYFHIIISFSFLIPCGGLAMRQIFDSTLNTCISYRIVQYSTERSHRTRVWQ